MLSIKNLHAGINGKEILKGLNLEVKPGEIHAIMGPNGSGKSTLTRVIMGHPNFQMTEGEITYSGQDLSEMEIDERAKEGIFVGYQYPVEIPGVTNLGLLRESFNALCEHQDADPPSKNEFMEMIHPYLDLLKMDSRFLNRPVNDGFSGGEKKKNEILQMLMLQPRLALLDETDSGLDIDALRIVAEGINRYRSESIGIVLITHYQRLLDYIKPDYIHVLQEGKIAVSGDYTLAKKLESEGYDWIERGV